MKLYVKKIWSTNPNLYIFLELNKAEKEYNKWARTDVNSSVDKTFIDWLETEIDTQPKENQRCKCCGGRFK
jgi:hypothetical protein